LHKLGKIYKANCGTNHPRSHALKVATDPKVQDPFHRSISTPLLTLSGLNCKIVLGKVLMIGGEAARDWRRGLTKEKGLLRTAGGSPFGEEGLKDSGLKKA
jgi:hypothetical protein